jgi:hypothetical protein
LEKNGSIGKAQITVAITATKYTTPIISQITSSKLFVQATNNVIQIANLPQNAKVEVYNLKGSVIYSANPGNPRILRIGVQTKGLYIVKVNSTIVKVPVK